MPVNEQVTDSITQVNTMSLGSAPAVALGSLFLPTSQALGSSAHNATEINQQGSIVMHTSTIQSINSMMAIGSSVLGRSAEAIIEKG